MSCLKMFSYILQVFVCNVWCCTVSNFYHAHDIFIIYCIGVGFLFVHLSSWIATYVYNGINIYRVWTNNRNTRQYRNKIIFVGCTDRMLFFCLCCIVPVSMHYRLYLVTVCMKAAFNKKKNLFTSKLNLNLRKRLVSCYVWSTALYGAETWTLRATDLLDRLCEEWRSVT